MGNEPTSLDWTGDEKEGVMTAVDEIGGEPHVIIADASCDAAWLAIPTAKARPLSYWR